MFALYRTPTGFRRPLSIGSIIFAVSVCFFDRRLKKPDDFLVWCTGYSLFQRSFCNIFTFEYPKNRLCRQALLQNAIQAFLMLRSFFISVVNPTRSERQVQSH